MASIDNYLELGTMVFAVIGYTGKASDGAAAAGYAAWVQSITGTLPRVNPLPGNKAQVILSQAQAQTMRTWIDNQIASSVKKSDSSLKIEFGPVISPLLVKYGLIYGVLAFGLGILAVRILR